MSHSFYGAGARRPAPAAGDTAAAAPRQSFFGAGRGGCSGGARMR